jgi:hypothetical protein
LVRYDRRRQRLVDDRGEALERQRLERELADADTSHAIGVSVAV